MAHIQLPEGLPGIRGPLAFSPATTQRLCDLAEALLRGPNTLTLSEREMIATYVSAQNDCYYGRRVMVPPRRNISAAAPRTMN